MMMDYILKALRPSKEEGMLILILHSTVPSDVDEKRFLISEGTYQEGGAPLVGELVEGHIVELFQASVDRRESVKRALRLLGYSDKSRKQLIELLVHRGFSPEVAREATEEAVRLGYLNERRAIEHAVLHMVEHKHYGGRRILPLLCAKGYPKPLVHEVISLLIEKGEVDFNEAFRALLLKKKVNEISDEGERKEKIRKLAYTYGFK